MFSIGDFSKITGLPVKTLRFYHEKEILIPTCVDTLSGYRYYDQTSIEKARIIICFRNMEFSISEIKEILDNYNDESDILDYLEQHKRLIESKIQKYKNITISLDNIISNEREAQMTTKNSKFEVVEKSLPSILIAGVRMKGKYSDCGIGFRKIGKCFGRYICGKPLCLYYDVEYRQEDANFEPCFPIRKGKDIDEISVRQLHAVRCVSLLHKGPYDKLGLSYAKILGYIKEKKYEIILPTREVYLKGPGIIFKGNPKNYLTEIQIPIQEGD